MEKKPKLVLGLITQTQSTDNYFESSKGVRTHGMTNADDGHNDERYVMFLNRLLKVEATLQELEDMREAFKEIQTFFAPDSQVPIDVDEDDLGDDIQFIVKVPADVMMKTFHRIMFEYKEPEESEENGEEGN